MDYATFRKSQHKALQEVVEEILMQLITDDNLRQLSPEQRDAFWDGVTYRLMSEVETHILRVKCTRRLAELKNKQALESEE